MTHHVDSLVSWKSTSRIAVTCRVIYAFILRDIKTRFFGNGFGYIVYIAWPFAHILILIVISYLVGRTYPFGDSLVVYSAVSLMPFLMFNYISRYIALTIITNRQLFNFPIATIISAVLARSTLEFFSISFSMFCVFSAIFAFGFPFIPYNIIELFLCFIAISLFSIGVGFMFCLIAGVMPIILVVHILLIVFLYIVSGIFFMPSALPQPYKDLLWFNPLTQLTEWFRFAAFADYPDEMINRPYIWAYILVIWFVAFSFECLLRGRILQG